jgi:hypothetical protein
MPSQEGNEQHKDFMQGFYSNLRAHVRLMTYTSSMGRYRPAATAFLQLY